MKIAMIGAGNLATNLAPALAEAGHDIVQVYSRTMESAQRLADIVGGAAGDADGSSVTAVDKLSDVTRDAELYVLALKDSALGDVVAELCQGREGAVFAHTAGSMPMDVFCGKAGRYGVIYPMQTFSKARRVDFAVIPIFVEASDEATLVTLENVARSVSDDVRRLDSEHRRYLHLAAVFACNFANHCYALAAEMVEQSGMTFDCMLPLIDETARKVHELSPCEAQTGPAVRYDRNVIGRQSRMLDGNPMAQRIYNIMSESIHNKSKDNDKL